MTTTASSGSRRALGRGLAALIPETGSEKLAEKKISGYRLLSLDRIKPNQSQPRKTFEEGPLEELAASIKDSGVLQPVLVRRHGTQYELVAGERRWRAAGRAGLREIPAIVQDLADSDVLKLALVENIQREDLDPLEEASAYHRLMADHGHTQEEVAKAVGKSRAAVANSLRLLKLPDTVIAMLADRHMTAGHARALMTLEREKDMCRLAQEIVKSSMSVRDAEHKARLMKKAAKKNQEEKPVESTAAERNVEERIMRSLSTKVRLHQRSGKGRIEIFFHSFEHLDSLLEKLAP